LGGIDKSQKCTVHVTTYSDLNPYRDLFAKLFFFVKKMGDQLSQKVARRQHQQFAMLAHSSRSFFDIDKRMNTILYFGKIMFS
jgi:hypothetical protein